MSEDVPAYASIADDLVDSVRRAARQTEEETGAALDAGMIRTDGLPVALPFAIVELLVEIRDGVRALDVPLEVERAEIAAGNAQAFDTGDVRIALVEDGRFDTTGLDVAIKRRMDTAGLWLDPARQDRVADAMVRAVNDWLVGRAKGGK